MARGTSNYPHELGTKLVISRTGGWVGVKLHAPVPVHARGDHTSWRLHFTL